MLGKVIGRPFMWLTIAASSIAGTASFYFLYRLGNDPIPSLAERFQTAACLQPIPFVVASILTVCLRYRLEILKFAFVAVIGCGIFGGWWRSWLAEQRRWENEPLRRRALGNILPDIEGQVGSVEALLWPIVVIGIVSGAPFIGSARCMAPLGEVSEIPYSEPSAVSQD